MIGIGPAEILVLAVMACVAIVVWLGFARRFSNTVRKDLRDEVDQLRRQVIRMQDEIEQLRDENERLRGQQGAPPETGIKH
ncbi:MAG TPA: hypothetical protein VFE62_24440 [Gemmataceae bacterium]|nr:hypothetical protein [Gemmataceae bacterium]